MEIAVAYLLCMPTQEMATRENCERIHNILARISDDSRINIVPEPVKLKQGVNQDYYKKYRLYIEIPENGNDVYLTAGEEKLILSGCRNDEETALMKSCAYAYQYPASIILKSFHEDLWEKSKKPGYLKAVTGDGDAAGAQFEGIEAETGKADDGKPAETARGERRGERKYAERKPGEKRNGDRRYGSNKGADNSPGAGRTSGRSPGAGRYMDNSPGAGRMSGKDTGTGKYSDKSLGINNPDEYRQGTEKTAVARPVKPWFKGARTNGGKEGAARQGEKYPVAQGRTQMEITDRKPRNPKAAAKDAEQIKAAKEQQPRKAPQRRYVKTVGRDRKQ